MVYGHCTVNCNLFAGAGVYTAHCNLVLLLGGGQSAKRAGHSAFMVECILKDCSLHLGLKSGVPPEQLIQWPR